MKLNDKFLIHNDGDTKFVVSTGNTDFNGIARGNETAGFIIDCLRSDTTDNEIVAKMQKKWEVSDEIARRDVRKITEQLRDIGAIEEYWVNYSLNSLNGTAAILVCHVVSVCAL